MLFTKNQNLAEMIIGQLTYKPDSSLEELQVVLRPLLNKKITRQGWYKALRVLLELEVIVKINKIYSLNNAWASHLSHLSFFIENNYLKAGKKYSIKLPRKEKEKVKFKFPNLLTMDSFWAHILVLLATQYPKIAFYAYNPHFWYFAAHQFETKRYFESMGQYKVENYTVVGARTDIDLWSEKLHPKKVSRYYCSQRQIMKNPREYFLVIADYFMTAKITEEMAQNIDRLFKEIKLDQDTTEPPFEVVNFFKQKSSCILTIEKNQTKADKFIRKIKRYF